MSNSKFILVSVLALGFILAVISYSGLQIQPAKAYTDGTLIKAANDPNIYVINNNLKVWVRSADVFNNCGYDWGAITHVTSLDTMPTADLIKSTYNPDVYRLEKNFKRKLASVEIFESYGLDWNKLATVCWYVLDSYSWAPLMQLEGTSNIYRLREADEALPYSNAKSGLYRCRYASWSAFTADGMQMRDVIEVNRAEFDSYADGTTIRASIKIYEPDGGEKFAIGERIFVSSNLEYPNEVPLHVDVYLVNKDTNQEYFVVHDDLSRPVEGFKIDDIDNVIVPDNVPLGDHYKLKVVNLVPGIGTYESDGYFSIVPADFLFKLSSPNGGERLQKGQTFNIQWNGQAFSSQDTVGIRLDDVSSKSRYIDRVIADVPNTGSYSWIVPSQVTLNYPPSLEGTKEDIQSDDRFKICVFIEGAYPSGGDCSDDYFEIID